jgi:hypothetical protein
MPFDYWRFIEITKHQFTRQVNRIIWKCFYCEKKIICKKMKTNATSQWPCCAIYEWLLHLNIFLKSMQKCVTILYIFSTRQGYENLLRDLLTCLAKKYRIEEPCGSSQVKHEIWRQLTNEYLQVFLDCSMDLNTVIIWMTNTWNATIWNFGHLFCSDFKCYFLSVS